jgi:hypothetical protein
MTDFQQKMAAWIGVAVKAGYRIEVCQLSFALMTKLD